MLVLAKTDLDEQHEREMELRELYESFHLSVFALSSETGEGVDTFAENVRSGVTAVVGNSGVGKSSLLNRLVPDLDLTVREVSAWSGKGTHTTTAALLVRIPVAESDSSLVPHPSSLIDTPGIKSFVPYGITKENLADLFPELAEQAPHCRFRNCRHIAEPGCAVMKAVEEGRLAESRIRSYQRMFSEIEAEY